MYALLLSLFACGSLTAAPQGTGPHRVKLHGEAIGTSWSVTADLPPEVDDAQVQVAIDAELAVVDATMSSWRTDSEIGRAVGSSAPVKVSAHTAGVVAEALDIARRTGGAYDPTVEPLMRVWGFRPNASARAPTAEALAEAIAKVGWQQVSLTERDGDAGLDTHGASLDLSSIAKGHGVDRVGDVLTGLGSTRWLVDVGGEVRGRGGRSAEDPWRVGVDEPKAEIPSGTVFAQVIVLRDGALATSGNYRNFHEVDGQRVAHTLDPRVGKPIKTHVLSASVVAPTCQTADGWATALMVLGTEGLPLIEALPGVDALLLLDDGTRAQTSGLGPWLQP